MNFRFDDSFVGRNFSGTFRVLRRHRRDPRCSNVPTIGGNTINDRYDHIRRGFRRRFTRMERLYERLGRSRSGHESSDEEEDEPTPGCLKVETIDLKIIKNTQKHETDEYEMTETVDDSNQKQEPKLVLRRGFSFTIVIHTNRSYKKESDNVSLQFAFGERPKLVKGSLVRLPLTDSFKDKEWAAVLKGGGKEDELRIEVHTPPDIFIGIWRMRVNITVEENKVIQTAPTEIYMLFNPFNKHDEVHMANVEDRKEYVMNEIGKIYVGTSKQIYPRTWNYAQFQGTVLECVVYMLDKSQLPNHARKSPVAITRKLSALINSSDDKGILMGNWSGDYAGGRSPLHWVGSEAIFEEYFKTKTSVKFGQCWVFSGVLTTALRALGIPGRSITNFSSAHDTDVSITIDRFYDEEGQPEDHMNDDSIWNFHVWNEAYMARSDLPDGYGGWQACDSTPQETSDGIYCCGPCPVNAIKLGDINVKYDAPFIFAEVNADKITWIKKPDGTYRSFLQNDGIGQCISTKSVLQNERNDVTHEYKCREGSGAERAAVLRAVSATSNRVDAYDQGPQDMTFDLDVDLDTMIGADFVVKVNMKNLSHEVRKIKGTIGAVSVFYTGVHAHTIKSKKMNCIVQPQSAAVVELLLKFDDYYKKIVDHCGIHLTAMAFVEETKQYGIMEEDFRLRKPDVVLKVPVVATVLEPFEIEISFSNPLKIALTNCILSVEGPGIQKSMTYPQHNVGPMATFYTTVKMIPKRAGKRTICACFSSQQIAGLEQESDIKVIA